MTNLPGSVNQTLLRKLFLSHHSEFASENAELAIELMLRGIVPWVDKDGGFSVGDDSPSEARRAILNDCFGFLLYATASAFDREFITRVEAPAALEARDRDDSFLLFAVPRAMDFSRLRDLSIERLGFDISPYHTVSVPDLDTRHERQRTIAREVLRRIIFRAELPASGRLALQLSTRDVMPHGREDILCINGAPLISDHVDDQERWDQLLLGLRDTKGEIARRWGRPRLQVGGSKHLTAAFMFGRVFSPMEMDIRQTPSEYWSTDGVASEEMLDSELILTGGEAVLTVEIASRLKDVTAGVDQYLNEHGLAFQGRLQIAPRRPPLDVDEAVCRSMVVQTYAAIEQATRRMGGVKEIHLFAAAPQSFMMMLGREFRGMPPTVHYEWAGREYVRACKISGGVL